jgi:hypothetical protein
MVFDFNRDDKVGLLDSLWEKEMKSWIVRGKERGYLETTVDEGFVEIEDQALSADMFRCDGGQERIESAVLNLVEGINKEEEKRRTGPMGMPEPPDLMRRSSSSSSCS